MPANIITIKVGINRCYIVRDKGTILIDAGGPQKIKTFRKAFEKYSINPNEINLIIITHGDPDHMGSASDLRKLTSSPIAIHEQDKLNFEKSTYNFPKGVNRWGRFLRLVLNPILKLVLPNIPGGKADIVLSDQDYSLEEYGIQGKIAHTPGHTKGSVSIVLDSGDAFVGCMAHNNPPFRLSPGLPIFADDIEKVKESWKKLLDRNVKTIYPAHGDSFSVDIIKRELET